MSILIRVSVMYVFALILVRISGKQSISELSTMDFVVITILGDPLDSVIYSEVPIEQGMVSFTTIVLLHLLVRFLASRNMFVFRLVSSPPTVMIQDGTVLLTGLRAEWVRTENLKSEIRLNRENKLDEIKEARLEENGRLSVLKTTPGKPAQKQDRKLLP